MAEQYNGRSTGLNVIASTAHPIRFSTKSFATGASNSIEIQATSTINLVVNEPLVYKPYASLPVPNNLRGCFCFKFWLLQFDSFKCYTCRN